MGKYRLQSRNRNSAIPIMEVDTECRAWYIKADHKEAAIKALQDMGKEILSIETIYINGDDVTDEVFSKIALTKASSKNGCLSHCSGAVRPGPAFEHLAM